MLNPQIPSKLTNRPFIALQRDEIKFHTTEHRHRLPRQGNLDKPLVQPHPEGAGSTIKRNHELPAYRNGTLNTAI